MLQTNRTRVSRPIFTFIAALGIMLLPRLGATEESQFLTDAESAYAAVDFEKTLSTAQKALEAGGLNHTQMVRAYKLIGISATALDQRDRGREAFVRMLAFDPDIQLEQNLSPALRGPFMEARGYWVTHPDRMKASVDLVRQRGALRVDVSDPLDMASSVVIRARVEGEDHFAESRLNAVERSYVDVDGADEEGRVEYSLLILDEYGNRILEFGDDEVPEVVGTASSDSGRPVARRAWFWVVLGVTAAVVAGGVTMGVLLWDQSETPSVSTHVSTVF